MVPSTLWYGGTTEVGDAQEGIRNAQLTLRGAESKTRRNLLDLSLLRFEAARGAHQRPHRASLPLRAQIYFGHFQANPVPLRQAIANPLTRAKSASSSPGSSSRTMRAL